MRPNHPRFWIIDNQVNEATLERLGDLRRVADGECIGALVIATGPVDQKDLIAHGADRVVITIGPSAGQMTKVATTLRILESYEPWLVMAPGDVPGREWAARLAARAHWRLVSPTLFVQRRDTELCVTTLDQTDRLSRNVTVGEKETAVITMRAGVGEALPADPVRRGDVQTMELEPIDEGVSDVHFIAADPATVDVRDAHRLIAGGRGLGNREGFDTLRALAAKLSAGIAASRMAVDLGWIEHDRQVGQTGKTVKPELYIACGISGASHHLEGMSDAKHIVAINSDPQAPIFYIAHLGLVADLHAVIQHVCDALGD